MPRKLSSNAIRNQSRNANRSESFGNFAQHGGLIFGDCIRKVHQIHLSRRRVSHKPNRVLLLYPLTIDALDYGNDGILTIASFSRSWDQPASTCTGVVGVVTLTTDLVEIDFFNVNLNAEKLLRLMNDARGVMRYLSQR